MIAVALLLLQSADVGGLRAGETAVVLGTSAVDAKGDQRLYVRSRTLDARTGTPLEGVRIETWTEDGVAPSFVQMQLDAAVTGRDGCARVCMQDGPVRTEKVRLSKPGYASLETGLSDAFDGEIPMFPARPLEGRVLDLEGRPVAGTLVRTRYSCAHAIPASQTHTDALGRFRMEDFPPCFGGSPEVEVVDVEHAPLFQLAAGDLRRQASFYGALDLYVPRSPPTQLQLVDAAGEPIPNRRVRYAEAAVTEGWTDDEGHCRLLPRQNPFEQTYELDDPLGHKVLYPAFFVDGLVTRIAPFEAAEGDALKGRITVKLTGTDGEEPLIVIVPEKGRFYDARHGEEARVPLGRARVIAGGDFTGFRQVSKDVVIAQRAQEVVLSLQPEPRLLVHQADAETSWFWVQAGDRSRGELNGRPMGEGVDAYPVPSGVPITVFQCLANGGLRRVFSGPIDVDTEVDLDAATSVLRHGLDEAKLHTTTLSFEVVDEAGHVLPKAKGEVTTDAMNMDSVPSAEGSFAWALPAHASYRIAFGAEGFTTAYLEGNVPLRAAERPERIVLTRRAQLRVGGKARLVDGFPEQVELEEGGFLIDAAPGPLTIIVEREDGSRIALDLVLAPGEKRRIDVP